MFNVTDIADFIFCNRKFYLKNVLKIKEEETEATLLGSIKHKFFELMNKEDESIIFEINENNYLKCEEMFYSKYMLLIPTILKNVEKKLFKFGVDPNKVFSSLTKFVDFESKYKAALVKEFIKVNKVFEHELVDKLEPKILAELKIIDHDIELKGIIDRVEFYKDFAIPIELKSGKPSLEGLWKGHKLQLAAYALLLAKNHSIPVKEGILFYIDHDFKKKIDMNPIMFDEVIMYLAAMKKVIEGKIPKHCSNINKCNKCKLKEYCFSLN